MGTQPIGKLLWRFSLPGVIGMLVNATYNLVDTIFVGGLGPGAIASLTVVFPIQIVLIAIGTGTGIGASSLISRRLGAGKPEEANAVVGQTLLIALIFGALMAVLGFSVGNLLLRNVLGASEAIAGNAYSYMIVITSGSVIIFLNIMGNNLVRAEGNPNLPMIVMVTGAVINIGLDPVFIYVLDLGVQGAAIATITSRAVSAIILIGYLISKRTSFTLKWKYFKLNFKLWWKIYKVGGPQALLNMVGSVVLAIVNNIAGTYGDIYIAVFGVLFRVFQFGFMPCIGIAFGSMPIIGYNFGAKKLSRVRGTLIRAALASTAITLTVAALAIAFPRTIVSVFNRDPEFLNLASRAMRISFLGFAFAGAQIAFASFFQGIGKGIPAAVIGLARQLLVLVPALFLLSHFFGADGIWFALPIADTIAFFISVTWTVIALCKLGIGLWGKNCKTDSTS